MKHWLFIIVLIFSFLDINAQHKNNDSVRVIVDTIFVTGDSVYATLRYFKSDTLIKVGNAYLIHRLIKIPKFHLFNIGWFNKEYEAVEIKWNGIKIEYEKGEIAKISNYKNGIKVYPADWTYFNGKVFVINPLFYTEMNGQIYKIDPPKISNTRGPCGTLIEYLIDPYQKNKLK